MSTEPSPAEPALAWPGWRHLGRAVLYSGVTTAWFYAVFGTCAWITDQHTWRVRVHLEQELAIPFVPQAALVYMSLNVLFWLLPFGLRQGEELRRAAATFAGMIAVAAVGFLLIPVDNHFPPDGPAGIWAGAVRLARTVALTHNYVPSLHVALSVACLAMLGQRGGRAWHALLWIWGLAIAASTLLLHQHYLIDVATGALLGWLGYWWSFIRGRG